MSIISWIVKQGLKQVVKASGPVVGGMITFTVEGIKYIDKVANDQQNEAIAKVRERNGGCPHILIAWGSTGIAGTDKVPLANNGDFKKTMDIGKRFFYTDITNMFWHPSISFLPDQEGLLGGVYLGSSEKIPEQSNVPTLRAAAPARGKSSCPFCIASVQKAAAEVNRYLEWDRNNR